MCPQQSFLQANCLRNLVIGRSPGGGESGPRVGQTLSFSSVVAPSSVVRKVWRADHQLPLASWPRAVTAGRDGISVGMSPVTGGATGRCKLPPEGCEGHNPATQRSRGPGPSLPTSPFFHSESLLLAEFQGFLNLRQPTADSPKGSTCA